MTQIFNEDARAEFARNYPEMPHRLRHNLRDHSLLTLEAFGYYFYLYLFASFASAFTAAPPETASAQVSRSPGASHSAMSPPLLA